MADCKTSLKKLVPLSRVVKASILDMHEDIGKSQELHTHWAARGFRKLNGEKLKVNIRRVLLTVNHNTQTATLPADCDKVIFVGFINKRGEKEAFAINTALTNAKGIETIECEDKCKHCQQPTAICEEINITEEVEEVDINGVFFERTTVKKLYPNGDYWLEVTNPVFNTTTSVVEYPVAKKYVTNFDLKECGCLETSKENLEKLKCYAYDTYCSYYTDCCPCSEKFGSYKVFDDTGLIQFDYGFTYNTVYVEYVGFIPKINGQYYVPQVAFETLVEWTKFKSVEGKNSRAIPNQDKRWRWDMYTTARRNMEKEMGKTKLSGIIQAVGLYPKFN